MIDVHVVAAVNRHLYERELLQYHQRRHDVFVGERGWSKLTCVDGREYDQYDDDHAIYLIAFDDKQVVGGQRFYPTVRPHMLSEVFPYLAQWPLPRGADIWECTRYFISRERRGGRAEVRLMIAIQQFCLEEGITSLTGVAEVSNLSRRLQAGIRFRPLGLPKDVDGEPTVAVVADMNAASFADSLAKLGARPVHLVRQGIDIGWVAEQEVAVPA